MYALAGGAAVTRERRGVGTCMMLELGKGHGEEEVEEGREGREATEQIANPSLQIAGVQVQNGAEQRKKAMDIGRIALSS